MRCDVRYQCAMGCCCVVLCKLSWMLYVPVASRVQRQKLRGSFVFFFVLDRIFIICSSEFLVSPESVSSLLRGLMAAPTPETTVGTNFSALEMKTSSFLDKVSLPFLSTSCVKPCSWHSLPSDNTAKDSSEVAFQRTIQLRRQGFFCERCCVDKGVRLLLISGSAHGV